MSAKQSEHNDNIPKELRERPQWLLRRAKVPHYPIGRKRHGMQGSAEDRAALGTFEQAIAALNNGSKYDGLGFAMMPEDTVRHRPLLATRLRPDSGGIT